MAEGSRWSSPVSQTHEIKACQGGSSLGQGASNRERAVSRNHSLYMKEYLLKTWLLTGSSWLLSGYSHGSQLQMLLFWGLQFNFPFKHSILG